LVACRLCTATRVDHISHGSDTCDLRRAAISRIHSRTVSGSGWARAKPHDDIAAVWTFPPKPGDIAANDSRGHPAGLRGLAHSQFVLCHHDACANQHVGYCRGQRTSGEISTLAPPAEPCSRWTTADLCPVCSGVSGAVAPEKDSWGLRAAFSLAV